MWKWGRRKREGEPAGRGYCLHSFVVAVRSRSELQVEPPTPLVRYIIPPQTKSPWFCWWVQDRGGAEEESGGGGVACRTTAGFTEVV